MGALTMSGVGSGLDIGSMVTALMKVERQPLTKLKKQQSDIDVQVSAYGKLKSAIADLVNAAKELGDPDSFAKHTVSSTSENVATVSAGRGAAAETHTITVTQLAQQHRLSSAAYASSTAAVGEGTYTFTYGTTSFDVTIDATNNTLAGLRDAINNATGNSGIGASIVNATGSSHLVLTAKQSGTANAITAPGGFGFTEQQAALNAELTVDGFAVSSASNTVTGVVTGLTINVKAVGSTTVTSAPDTGAMTKTMQDFATAYNGLVNRVKSLRTSDLKGEGLLMGVESTLRNLMFGTVTNAAGESESAIDYGFTFSKEGTLSVNNTKANARITDNLVGVLDFFGKAETGLGKRLTAAFDRYTDSNGIIQGRTDGLSSRRKALDSQIDRFESRMEMVEKRYRTQFSKMDALVAQLRQTSSQLTSALGR